jgi:hypothetical protein
MSGSDEMEYEPGQWVRLIEAQYGTAQGPSVEHGDGEMREVPAGAVCEVFAVDRTTSWLTLHFDLEDSGPREPYRVELIVGPKEVEPTRRPRYGGWDGTLPHPPTGLG